MIRDTRMVAVVHVAWGSSLYTPHFCLPEELPTQAVQDEFGWSVEQVTRSEAQDILLWLSDDGYTNSPYVQVLLDQWQEGV